MLLVEGGLNLGRIECHRSVVTRNSGLWFVIAEGNAKNPQFESQTLNVFNTVLHCNKL